MRGSSAEERQGLRVEEPEIDNGPGKSDAFGAIIDSHNVGRYDAGVAILHGFIQL
jgi:hypothetical protein